MTSASSDELSKDEYDAILAAIAKLADRIERRSDEVDRPVEQADSCFDRIESNLDRIDDDIKTIRADLLDIKLLVRRFPTYWHMYGAIVGLVVTAFILMRFAMPD